MNKFIDDVRVVFEADLGPPRTPSQLLSRLNLHGEPKAIQRVAVAEWLKTNEPNRVMRIGLEVYELVEAPFPWDG
jgi:hypothetical protein